MVASVSSAASSARPSLTLNTPLSSSTASSATISQQPTNTSVHDNTVTFSDLIPYISIIIIIVGWSVIYRNAKRIATRNETKSIVDDIVKIIDDIEKMTTEYWLSGRRARSESSQFLVLAFSKINTLNGRLKILKRRGLDIRSLSLTDTVEHMTLDCEDVDRISDGEKHQRVELFLESSNLFVDCLYEIYEKRYTPSMGYISMIKKTLS